MDEYVLSSTIPGDEAEALVDIEPFHGALGAPVAPTRFAQDSLQEGRREVASNPRSPTRGSMVVDTATAMSGWQLLPGCGSLSRAAGRDRSIASSLRIIVSIFWVRRKKKTQINVQ